MKIQLHTPKGIITVDTETVTNEQLASPDINTSREVLNSLIPRDIKSELDALKVELKAKGIIS